MIGGVLFFILVIYWELRKDIKLQKEDFVELKRDFNILIHDFEAYKLQLVNLRKFVADLLGKIKEKSK